MGHVVDDDGGFGCEVNASTPHGLQGFAAERRGVFQLGLGDLRFQRTALLEVHLFALPLLDAGLEFHEGLSGLHVGRDRRGDGLLLGEGLLVHGQKVRNVVACLFRRVLQPVLAMLGDEATHPSWACVVGRDGLCRVSESAQKIVHVLGAVLDVLLRVHPALVAGMGLGENLHQTDCPGGRDCVRPARRLLLYLSSDEVGRQTCLG